MFTKLLSDCNLIYRHACIIARLMFLPLGWFGCNHAHLDHFMACVDWAFLALIELIFLSWMAYKIVSMQLIFVILTLMGFQNFLSNPHCAKRCPGTKQSCKAARTWPDWLACHPTAAVEARLQSPRINWHPGTTSAKHQFSRWVLNHFTHHALACSFLLNRIWLSWIVLEFICFHMKQDSMHMIMVQILILRFCLSSFALADCNHNNFY